MTNHSHESHRPLTLADFRQSLAQKQGKTYWRSLEELADSDEFEKLVKQEFPRQAGLLGTLNRRDFLKVLGASLAMAGLTACVPQAQEKIVPYVRPPEELIPAKSIYFASSMVQDGFAKGVLIETTMGRPIKVEGNPLHPASLGGTDVWMQASILELYDPERAKQVTNQGAASTWQDFVAALGQANLGQGLRILSGPVTSPTLINQMTALLTQFPDARWVQYSPVYGQNTAAGAALAFGQPYQTIYNFTGADVVLSLDSDFLLTEPGHLRYSRDFKTRHQPVSASGTMSRLYVVESSMSLTGSNADHRLGVKPSQVETFARAIASRLGVNVAAPEGDIPGQDWLEALAADLQNAGRAALVVAGERQPAAVHALAHAMNQALGSVGNTVTIMNPVTAAAPDEAYTLQSLVDDLNAGTVQTLVMLDGNPAYSMPADLNFGEAIKQAQLSIYLGLYADETAAQATWFVPAAHYMEMWGDARAYDGTVSLIQPVIEPLYGGKSPYELLAALLGQGDAKGYDIVRQYWGEQASSTLDDRNWREALGKGTVPNTGPSIATAGAGANAAAFGDAPAAVAADQVELVIEADPTIWDGRFSNNSWLQELPKPLTKLVWDNAAFINPVTASRLGLAQDDVVTLAVGERSVEAPVYIEPGQPENVVAVSLGYGRTAGGELATGRGFNAYSLRTSDAPWFATNLQVSKTGRKYQLVSTQTHWSMDNRDLVRSASLEEYQNNPEFAHDEEVLETPTLYGEEEYTTYAWGMSINLNTCIGCNACVVACQAENNIPTVGKDQVANSREMHWLRIDRYYEGNTSNPAVLYQPMLCQHCEKAPCEPVCPVEATSHSTEGINEMTYNRCVGTRYCSNNCPYKVRRFNFFKYTDDTTESLKAMRNPDVTVRMRGVMEKCTYCVQRVNQARIQANVEGRQIGPNEVLTACQQACPTNAIVFGDINNAESNVRSLKESPLTYGVLAELGTQPRTTYLAKVRNTNPLIKEG